CRWIYFVWLFFFFQAEDGIRDKLVTGVQTCALPIFDDEQRHALDFRGRREPQHRFAVAMRAEALEGPALVRDLPLRVEYLQQARSEERRVGKECRSRWSPDH